MLKMEYKFSPAQSPGYLLWQVHLKWQRKIKQELDKLDLTHTQFVLMAVTAKLSESQKIVTQSDIAEHSACDRMMVSKVLRTLEGKKLIKRKDDKRDTRIKSISLTESGYALTAKAVAVVEAVDSLFFEMDSSKQVAFIEVMNDLNGRD